MKKYKISKEADVHKVFNRAGIETNHKKKENAKSYDIIALYKGDSFLVEHKLVRKQKNGTYEIRGDTKGEVLIVSLPSGSWFFMHTKDTSMTKTCRLANILYTDLGI